MHPAFNIFLFSVLWDYQNGTLTQASETAYTLEIITLKTNRAGHVFTPCLLLVWIVPSSERSSEICSYEKVSTAWKFSYYQFCKDFYENLLAMPKVDISCKISVCTCTTHRRRIIECIAGWKQRWPQTNEFGRWAK